MTDNVRNSKLLMKERAFLKKRLALSSDLILILIAWMIVFFTIVTNFFFYQRADPNDLFFLSNSWVPGLELATEKVIESMIYLGGIAAAITVVFIMDRRIAFNRARKLGLKLRSSKSKEKFFKLDKKLALLIVVVFLLSIPWLLAQMGLYAGDFPLLDKLFYSKQVPNLDGQSFPAVHLGHHHGYDGAIIFSLMILVIPLIKWIYNKRIKFIAGIAWSVMITFSFYQFAEDFINEQILKRIPVQSFLPGPSVDIIITLPLAILIGIMIYALVWKHQESKVI